MEHKMLQQFTVLANLSTNHPGREGLKRKEQSCLQEQIITCF